MRPADAKWYNMCRASDGGRYADLIDRTLADFAAAPLTYDLSGMCSEEEMQKMAEIFEALRKELKNV